MRYKIFLISIYFGLFLSSFSLWGAPTVDDVLPYKKNLKEKILKGEIFSEAKVSDAEIHQNLNEKQLIKKTQTLNFLITGLHPKSCSYALKKLSQYESFSHFLEFVKESQYDEKKQEINFMLSHALLPFDMRLIFNLPRITAPGEYLFQFKQGFLKDLKGKIHVVSLGEKCLFHTSAHWSGPHTKFPNKIFELFSQTLSRMSMEKLFRVSSTLGN